MQIWSAEIKELEKLHDSFKGHLPDLEKELEKLIKTDDENILLIYSRRCLEVIITDLCECELKRPRKTEPLKGIIDKLNREEKVPPHIITSMDHLNSLSVYGAHPKDFDPEQVKPALINLATIIRWYLKYKDTQAIGKPKAEEVKDVIRASEDSSEQIQKPKKRLILLLSGLAMVVVIVAVALFVFEIIGGRKQTKEPDKSIAVLPFVSLSDDPEKQYLADGMMDAILLHLSKIEDLRVMSRTSVEQYRRTDKTSGIIGRELGVAYLLEGSFQKYGDNARLIVQLIKTGKEGHEWANEYDRNWNDIFSVQSEVAQTIARELHAVITPEEKQLIEKTPTSNLTAYDFYQRGRDEYLKYWIDNDNRAALKTAEDFYHKALKYDSTFAGAYEGLARVYINKYYFEEYLSENYLDSVLILTDLALTYDNQLAEAYEIRAVYYYSNGKVEQALKELDKALKYNPNYWEVYRDLGLVYLWNNNNLDFVKAIENLHRAVSLNHGVELPSLLRSLGNVYGIFSGFLEKANFYYQEALKLDRDSANYYSSLAGLEESFGNYRDAVNFFEISYTADSNSTDILKGLGWIYTYNNEHEKSLKYFKKYVEKSEVSGQERLNNMHRIGFAYWQNGYKKEAEYYFYEQKRYCEESIKMKRDYAAISLGAYYDLAGVYAFMGDKDKAYENLRIWARMPVCPLWWLNLLKIDPLFDSIRSNPEFQQIVSEMEAKYQAEHERVRKWIEEQGI